MVTSLSSSQQSDIILMSEYAAWAQSRWMLAKLPGIEPALASELVMVTGLAGETGEVAEVLDDWLQTGILDNASFSKEIGDAIYYWARLVPTFGLDAGTLFVSATPLASQCVSQGRVIQHVLQLTVAQGIVCEAFKKYVRDRTLSSDKIKNGLYQYALSWRQLCQSVGYDWRAILTQNQDKIEGRNARGTMRGSGNER